MENTSAVALGRRQGRADNVEVLHVHLETRMSFKLVVFTEWVALIRAVLKFGAVGVSGWLAIRVDLRHLYAIKRDRV